LSSNLGNIGGEIRDNSGDLITNNVRVTLGSNEVTVSNGTYLFENLECGLYILSAEDIPSGKKSINYFVSIPGDYRCVTRDITICFCDEEDDKLPILLVPGIMGSSDKNDGFFPKLSKNSYEWDKDELKLVRPKKVGWKQLNEALTNEVNGYKKGCNLFEVPYDWRWDLNTTIPYLKNWIDKAKQESNKNEVNIIAHSTGGLLVRAYIQDNDPDHIYENDIYRFAMVGTPNMGSANAYYMWEGGDPLLVDNIVRDGPLWRNFYWHTTLENYNAANDENIRLDTERNRRMIWNYFTGGDAQGESANAIICLKQLMPTYCFLGKQTKKTLEVVKNRFLIDLNEDDDKHRMGIRSSDKVETAVFLSESENTIEAIDVGHSGDLYYKDGYPIPERDTNSASFPESAGDGTVLKVSAEFPWSEGEGWADKHMISGKHVSLMKECVPDLIKFINGTLVFNDVSEMSQISGQTLSAATADEEYILSLSYRGRIQPYLVDSLDNGCGIAPITNIRENNITGAVITVGPDSGNVEITNVSSETFTLHIKNAYSEDFNLNIGLMNNEYAENFNYHGFVHSETLSFTLNVDLLSEDKITINHEPSIVTSLEAQAVESGGLQTSLIWDASADPTVIAYNIYSKIQGEIYLSLLGTTSDTFYDTGHPWTESSSVATRFYVVSAVKADGSESFLSDMVKNDDQDHDGLTDEEETAYGSIVDNPDSDGDGLLDGQEYSRNTNPLLIDTDGDEYSDYDELQAGSDPLDENSFPEDSIPTISEWGMIVFALLLTMVGMVMIRRRQK